MRNLIDQVTNSLNFDKFFTYPTGELCKLSSVILNIKQFAERDLTKEELEELKDYFIERIKVKAQARAEEMIENNEIENIEEFSFDEFQEKWIDEFVNINV